MLNSAVNKIYQGEDITINLTLIDSDEKEIELDQFTDIIMSIFQYRDTPIFIGRDTEIKWTRLSEYEYQCIVESSITSGLPPGKYNIEINFVQPDSRLSDNRMNRITASDAFILQDSQTKDR